MIYLGRSLGFCLYFFLIPAEIEFKVFDLFYVFIFNWYIFINNYKNITFFYFFSYFQILWIF